MRRLFAALIAAATAIMLPAFAASPAYAEESYVPDSSGTFSIAGHGYGHGRGLSQWGAYGAATKGLTYTQILAFYYPGTYLTGQYNERIIVRLSHAEPGQVAVDHISGMKLNWSGNLLSLPDASAEGYPIANWRLRNTGGGLYIDFVDTVQKTWRQYSYVPGTSAYFQHSTKFVRMIRADYTRGEYRGLVGAVISGSGIQAVNSVFMEDYLRSVVPSEMPASWAPAALQSQAVAARTYASRDRYVATGSTHTCDTVQCQVYNGIATYSTGGSVITTWENAATDAAVSATANRVLITGGAYSYVFAQFGSSNGGYMVAGSQPYLVAKPDPYDGVIPNASNSWTTTITSAKIKSAYPTIGTPTKLIIVQRDGNGEWGGRIESMKVVGTAGSVTVTGPDFRFAMGLKSAWWTVTNPQTVTPQSKTQPNGGLFLDVTGDYRPELFGRDKSNGNLVMYRGQSNMTFANATVVGGGWNIHNYIGGAGDVNCDGIPDIYARNATTGYLYLYTLNRSGVATNMIYAGAGWQTMDMIIPTGDLNGDGVPDLYAREASTGNLYFYTASASGGFTSRTLAGGGWGGWIDIILGSGDHTGDGKPDLLARATDGRLMVYGTNSAGKIVSSKTINYGWNMFDMVGSAPIGNTTYLYGKNPNVNGGQMYAYYVGPTGAVQGPDAAGAGWNMFNIFA